MLGAEVLRALIPIVAGAVVAAISAWLKTVLDRRDARKQAERRLALAKARTEFAAAWYDAGIRVGGDDRYLAGVTEMARLELQGAYEDSQRALAQGRADEQESAWPRFLLQLRKLLALGPYRSQGSYVVTALLYVWIALMTVGAFASPDDEYFSGLAERLVYVVLSYIVSRAIAQLPIAWLESRAARRAEGGTR